MPTTGKYALVQINSIYLTHSGLVGGRPCRTEIGGLNELATTGAFQVIKALSGTPYLQTSSTLVGKPISIAYVQMEESVYDSIVAIIQAYITSGTAITITITNTPYATSFALSVVPDAPPVKHEHEFQNTSLKNGSFHFLTT
jgi:predicted proteasome-type protease